jgi:hypothetical protein
LSDTATFGRSRWGKRLNTATVATANKKRIRVTMRGDRRDRVLGLICAGYHTNSRSEYGGPAIGL